MPAKYKYTFTNTTSGSLALTSEPLNWSDLTLTFKRSKVFEGVSKSFSQDLSFWGDGNDYLREVYSREGINSQVDVLVEIFDLVTYTYETLFTGRVNFSNYTEELSDDGLNTVNTNIESSLFEQQIEKGASIDIDVFKLEDRFGDAITPFTDYEEVKPSLAGQNISGYYSSLIEDGSPNTLYSIDTYSDDGFGVNYHFSFDLIKDTNTVLDVDYPSTFIGLAPPNKIWTVEVSGEATITYDLNYRLYMLLSSGTFTAGNSQLFNFTIVSKNFGVMARDTDLWPTNSTILFDTTLSHQGSITANFKEGDEISLYITYKAGFTGGGTTFNSFQINITDYTFSIASKSVFKRTLPRGMFPFEIFSRVVNFLTGESDRVIGDTISRTNQTFNPSGSDGDASKVLISSGRGVRNFPDDESPLVVNLKTLFESFKYGFNIGLGFVEFGGNETVIVDDIDTFYGSSTILTITSAVKNPRMSLSSDGHWTNLKFGFTKYKIEDRNFQSTQEFNTQRSYNSAVQVMDKTETILSPFIGAGFGLEYQRRKPWFAPTDENAPDQSRFDDDKFLISLTENDQVSFISEGISNQAGGAGYGSFARIEIGEANGLNFAWNNIYGELALTELTNEILFNNGAPGFSQTEYKVTEATTVPQTPFVSVDMGGIMNIPAEDSDYTVTVTVDGELFYNINPDFPSSVVFNLMRKDPLVVSPVIVDTLTWDLAIDSIKTIALSDTHTVLSTDPDKFYYIEVQFNQTSGAQFDSMNIQYTSAEFIFKMITTDQFQEYRQENATDYFGPGVVVTAGTLVNSDSSLNFRISPRQAMERHKKTLGAVNYRLTPNKFTFSGDPIGNVLVATTNPTFAENDDIDTNEEHTYEFEMLDFETEWDFTKSKLVDANRYGLIVVDTDDIQFTGFVEEIVHEVEDNTAQITLKRKITVP